MKWKGRRASANVEDRRGSKALLGGGITTIIVAVVVMLMGGNPLEFLSSQGGVETPYEATAEERELADFVSVVLAETEDVWSELLKAEKGKEYECPSLVLYKDSVQSGCGLASAAAGPFYCPSDQKVYLDLSFCTELKERFRAEGDFAIAYVIAHEIGHHVQYLLGDLDRVQSQRGRIDAKEYNKLMVKLELQADYYAGVWAHHVGRANLLEEGDLEEALNAASAVGDDRIQQQTTGRVDPDTFQHGTSEQRAAWFLKGYKSGAIADGDTFNAPELND